METEANMSTETEANMSTETEANMSTETSVNICISIIHLIAEGSDLQLQICRTEKLHKSV